MFRLSVDACLVWVKADEQSGGLTAALPVPLNARTIKDSGIKHFQSKHMPTIASEHENTPQHTPAPLAATQSVHTTH